MTVPKQSLHGNFNLDNVVDANDIPAMLQALTDLNAYANGGKALGATLSISDLNTLGDFDDSGTATSLGVNNKDIQGMLDYIAGLSGSGSVSSVPEPSTFLLGALGLIGIAGMWRRRNRSQTI